MTAGLGHNGGPSLEGGTAWRAHCWRAAREALLPKLPIEVVRLRVKRAKEIGLDYRTYAGFRASTGHDLVAFLFSTNALRLVKDQDRMRAEEAAKLAGLSGIGQLVAVQPPLDPARVADTMASQSIPVIAANAAPGLAMGWRDTRDRLLAFAAAARTPADRILVIGDTTLEAEWAATARMAGYLPTARFFAPDVRAR
ncbi:MAG TPA: hypothetical protein PLI43_13435 [Albidovulum sp.]|uniref:hypothetical protein n=1 Tax=Albidovulum sp. TaxID=1872424 RepID=UPI002C10F301|nr:hypothetical protein [Albidovulum sp.]